MDTVSDGMVPNYHEWIVCDFISCTAVRSNNSVVCSCGLVAVFQVSKDDLGRTSEQRRVTSVSR